MLRNFLKIVMTVAVVSGGLTAEYGMALAQTGVARLVHTPTLSLRENESLMVEARVDGLIGRVAFMRLYFRTRGESSFQYIEMHEGMGEYNAELPPQLFAPPEIEYFILTMLPDQSVITHPELNPYGNAHLVTIAAPAPEAPAAGAAGAVSSAPTGELQLDESDGPVMVLSPEANEEFDSGEEVLIAFSILDPDSIDLGSVNLLLDDVNITLDAEVTENLVTYTTIGLPPGIHTASVKGFYSSGVELPALSWSFIVKGELRGRPSTDVSFHGRVFAGTRQEKTSDINFSDNSMGGNVRGHYGVTKYDARLYLTSRETAQFQPRHRFTFNFEAGPLGMTLGDIYPRFNDLMLWGKRVRGIHGRLHFGFFNLDFLTGETVRKVSAFREVVIDTTSGNPFLNSAGADSSIILRFGTFKQKMQAARASFGSGRNFQLGFNLVKSKDSVSSLDSIDIGDTPKDNLVIGTDLLIAFDNHRIELIGSAAGSAITNDIRGGPLSKEELEASYGVDINVDPADFADWLIINASTVPLDPRDGSSSAYNVRLRLNYYNNDLRIGYKRIGSVYQSLGNAFLRNNIKGFYFDDRVRLYQNKIYLNLGFENFTDNFKEDNLVPATDLRSYNIGFSLFPGPRWPNLSFNWRNYIRDNGIDSLVTDNSGNTFDQRENNKSKDLTAQINYDTQFLSANHNLSMSFIRSDRNDIFSGDRLPGIPSFETSSNIGMISVRSRYNIPMITTLTISRNENDFSGGLNEFKFTMAGLRVEYFFMNRALQTYALGNYTSASGLAVSDTVTKVATAITDYKRTTFGVGGRYEISRGQYLVLDANLSFFSDNGQTFRFPNGLTPNPSFTDRALRFLYEMRF